VRLTQPDVMFQSAVIFFGPARAVFCIVVTTTGSCFYTYGRSRVGSRGKSQENQTCLTVATQLAIVFTTVASTRKRHDRSLRPIATTIVTSIRRFRCISHFPQFRVSTPSSVVLVYIAIVHVRFLVGFAHVCRQSLSER
jgi:hypothetical protein